MPQAYVAKLAKEHHITIQEAEAIWERAKEAAGDGASYAIVTTIFKNMMHERSEKKKKKK